MTTRDKAIEAMARAMSLLRGHAALEELVVDATAALDALRAVLDAEGLHVVPVEATEGMKQRVSGAPYAGNWVFAPGDAYAAMLAASPDPLAQENANG